MEHRGLAALLSAERIRAALLGVILVVATLLRVAGIDRGLRRAGPDGDEYANHLAPMLHMASQHSADPRGGRGYPGFFNYVALPAVAIGFHAGDKVGAAAAGRLLVAAFAVLNVWLAYLVTKRLAGAWAGLFSAALLALSRGDIRAAHFISPDILVLTGLLLVLLLLVGTKTPRYAWAGLVAGFTIATKWTALLILPAIAVSLLRARPRLCPAVLALAGVMAGFILGGPYIVFEAVSRGQTGLALALHDYYSPQGYGAQLLNKRYSAREGRQGAILGYVVQNAGALGTGLALAGSVVAARRGGAPVLVTLLASLAAMLPAQMVYPRHALFPSTLTGVLAGCGIAVVGRQGAVIASLVGLAALVQPASSATRLVERFLEPTAVDLAADWIETNRREGLVAVGLRQLTLAPDRFEARSWLPLGGVPTAVLGQYDLLVGRVEDVRPLGFPIAKEFSDADGIRIAVAEGRPRRIPLPPPDQADSSEGTPGRAVWDGRGGWKPSGGGWLAGSWNRPEPIGGIIVETVRGAPTDLTIEVRAAGGPWKNVEAWPIRPGRLVRQRAGAERGQIFVFAEPVQAGSLRLSGRGAWELSSVRAFASPP